MVPGRCWLRRCRPRSPLVNDKRTDASGERWRFASAILSAWSCRQAASPAPENRRSPRPPRPDRKGPSQSLQAQQREAKYRRARRGALLPTRLHHGPQDRPAPYIGSASDGATGDLGTSFQLPSRDWPHGVAARLRVARQLPIHVAAPKLATHQDRSGSTCSAAARITSILTKFETVCVGRHSALRSPSSWPSLHRCHSQEQRRRANRGPPAPWHPDQRPASRCADPVKVLNAFSGVANQPDLPVTRP